MMSAEIGGGTTYDVINLGSRSYRSSNWQNGQDRDAVSMPPSVSRNSLPQRGHDAS